MAMKPGRSARSPAQGGRPGTPSPDASGAGEVTGELPAAGGRAGVPLRGRAAPRRRPAAPKAGSTSLVIEMGTTELHRPIAGMQRPPLILDEVQEGQDRRELAGGDHRIWTLEAAPERERTRSACGSVRACVDPAQLASQTSCSPPRSATGSYPCGMGESSSAPPARLLPVRGSARSACSPSLRLAKCVSHRRFVQRTQRRHIGIVTRGDLRRMADREARHVALRLEIPQRLVGLAQAGQEEAERTPIVVDDARAGASTHRRNLRVANAGAENVAGAAIDPKALARMVPAGPAVISMSRRIRPPGVVEPPSRTRRRLCSAPRARRLR